MFVGLCSILFVLEYRYRTRTLVAFIVNSSQWLLMTGCACVIDDRGFSQKFVKRIVHSVETALADRILFHLGIMEIGASTRKITQ